MLGFIKIVYPISPAWIAQELGIIREVNASILTFPVLGGLRMSSLGELILKPFCPNESNYSICLFTCLLICLSTVHATLFRTTLSTDIHMLEVVYAIALVKCLKTLFMRWEKKLLVSHHSPCRAFKSSVCFPPVFCALTN